MSEGPFGKMGLTQGLLQLPLLCNVSSLPFLLFISGHLVASQALV